MRSVTEYTASEWYGEFAALPVNYAHHRSETGVIVQHKNCSEHFCLYDNVPEFCKDCKLELVCYVGGEF